MPLTGYSHATTPNALILGPMVLFVGGVPHSASRGVRAEFIDEVTQPQIDGLVAPMAGTDYIAGRGLRITGQFLEASAAAIARYQSNTTGVLAGGVTTYTPRTPGIYLPSLAGYVEDVAVRFKDGAGNTHTFAIPAAHVVSRSMDGVDGFTVTLEARSTDPEVVPYTYTIAGLAPVNPLSDTFTRADSAVAPGNAETGQVYTQYNVGAAATFGISTNRLYVPVLPGDYSFLVADGTVANGTLSVTISTSGNPAQIGQSGLAARMTNASNGIALILSADSILLLRREAGVWTTLNSIAVTWASGDTLSLVMNGTALEGRQNGVLRVSATEPFNQAVTTHGIAVGPGVGDVPTFFDNLLLEALP